MAFVYTPCNILLIFLTPHKVPRIFLTLHKIFYAFSLHPIQYSTHFSETPYNILPFFFRPIQYFIYFSYTP